MSKKLSIKVAIALSETGFSKIVIHIDPADGIEWPIEIL